MTQSDSIISQLPGLASHYTKHPIFRAKVLAMIMAGLISMGMNFAMALTKKDN